MKTKPLIFKPMMIVDCPWKTPRKLMTPDQQKTYEHWCNEIHIPDLLRGTGMTRIMRYRNRDGSGIFYIQEFENEDAMEKYLVSDRRKELRHETESHYPGGDGPDNYFDKRIVKCFIPVAGKERG